MRCARSRGTRFVHCIVVLILETAGADAEVSLKELAHPMKAGVHAITYHQKINRSFASRPRLSLTRSQAPSLTEFSDSPVVGCILAQWCPYRNRPRNKVQTSQQVVFQWHLQKKKIEVLQQVQQIIARVRMPGSHDCINPHGSSVTT